MNFLDRLDKIGKGEEPVIVNQHSSPNNIAKTGMIPMPKLIPKLIQKSDSTKKCGTCGKNKREKTFGVSSLVKAKTSGYAPEEIQKERLQTCINCTHLEKLEIDGKPANGKPLFRIIDNVYYCGVPRLKNILRNEYDLGCGCDLEDKVQYNAAECPRGEWGEVPIS